MIIDFAKYSSVRIGSTFKLEVLRERREFEGFIVGGANNLLVSNAPKRLAILGEEFDYIKLLEENECFSLLEIGCASRAKELYNFAKKQNLSGFECLGKIPGRLGGLLKMNAGLKEQCISDHLVSLSLAKKELLKEQIAFSYRHCALEGVIFKAVFKLAKGFDSALDDRLKTARSNQPSGASFGSIFKNPKADFAGRLIEAVGLKGFKKGGAMISPKHANFLINTGKASFEDALFLIELCEKKVFEDFGINLEREVVVI